MYNDVFKRNYVHAVRLVVCAEHYRVILVIIGSDDAVNNHVHGHCFSLFSVAFVGGNDDIMEMRARDVNCY